MRQTLSALTNKVIFILLVALAALTPIVFTSLTTEFFETPKIILLAVLVLVMLMLWVFSWVLEGKVIITRTPLDLPLLLLAATVLISTFLSDSRYVAIFGSFPRIHGSAITWILYILLYFIAVSNIKNVFQARIIIFGLIAAAVINSIIAILSYAGIYLPLGFTKSMIFNPAGSAFSAVSLILILLPIIYIHILRPTRYLSMPLGLVTSIIFSITLVLIGSLYMQIIGLALVLLTIFFTDKMDIKSSLPFLITPIIVSVVILALTFIPLAKKNPLEQKRMAFTQFQEVQLPASASWNIAISAFRDAPSFGTGPGTYIFNYTQYRPAELNLTKLWNLRFDTGFNEFFQVLTTIGILGFLAFVFFSLMLVKMAVKVLRNNDSLTAGLGLSVLGFFILLLFHVSTPVSMVAGLFVLVCLISFHKSEGKVEEFTLGVKASRLKEAAGISSKPLDGIVTGDVLPIILFIPIAILSLMGLWQAFQISSADFYHRRGLNSINQKGLQAYDYLRQAETLNPYIDLYRTDMAQTNFLIANAIATAKAPNEASPGGSLTDQDKSNIQQFLSQSINESRAAVTLSPKSAQNWEILASIYRQITGVAQNALQFSLEGYGRAITLDPFNPLLRLNVGGLYYSIRNYDLAIRFFDDAVKLKPDYANAYYNLSIALRDKGSLDEAQTIAERVVQLLQNDTENPDYKVAADYLKDLKARIATGSAQKSDITAPAGTQTGALQNDNLPKVPLNELQTQPSVATPPAVKR